MLTFCQGSCFAQQEATFDLLSFEGGLNSKSSPYLIAANECITASNVRFDTEYGSLSKRASMTLKGATGYAVRGLHRYYKSDGTANLVHAGSTFLKYGETSYTTLKNGLTSGLRWTFVTYQDVMIGMNGTDNPQKWDGEKTTTDNTDGARTANLLTTDLGAPFAELNTGANLDASSWYQYRIAYYDGSVFKYSTSRSNPILTGAAVQDITLVGIPIGPTGTTTRYIYRTLGNASQVAVEADTTFYLIATIADNSTLTINDAMTDDTADDDAVPVLSTVETGTNVTPPLGKYSIIHAEKLFISGNNTDRSDINWSDDFNPDYFSLADFIQVRPDDGDAITFMNTELGNLIIGKTNTIQKLYTDNNSIVSWYMSDPFSYIGCPAPYSAENTPNGLYYLGWDGVYIFNGFNSKLISVNVSDQIADILSANIDETVGIFHDNKYLLSYTSVDAGGSTNNRVLIHDLITDSFSIDIKSIDSFVVFNSGSDSGTLYSGDSTATGNIYSHAPGSSEAAIATTWESGWTDLGNKGRKSLLNRFKIFYTGTAGSLVFTYTNDEGDTADSFTIDLSVAPTDDIEDLYTGVAPNKIYTYYPEANSETVPEPIGQYWKFKFTEGAGTVWNVERVEVRFEDGENDA